MILILGPRGTLGSAVGAQLEALGEDYQTTYLRTHVWQDMKRVLSQLPRRSVIINCAGDIHRDPIDEDRMFASNVVGPLVVSSLAELYGLFVLHVSTDCVFHGGFGEIHKVDSPTSPADFYGYTKTLGESHASDIVNVRTSFIAPNQGIWADVREGKPLVGWSGVYWSGGTVGFVAREIAMLALRMHVIEGDSVDVIDGVVNVDGNRIVHLATDIPISKYDVLRTLAPHKPIRNEPFPCYSRALEPTITMPPLLEQFASEGISG